ncbi:MAG TPA: DinB family protein [Holophagaceae bacterium]|nr:DinB family protein [Holophagaceae bacterium]
MHPRPAPDEFAPYYAGYIAKVPEGADVLEMLEAQKLELKALFGSMSEDQALYFYAPGKWSLKQLVGHLIDAERVFSQRVFRFSREDATPMPSFEEDAYVAHGHAETRPMADLLEELLLLRSANLLMFRALSNEAWNRRGEASGKVVSVRALLFITAGHLRHHLDVVRERYLPELPTRGR